MGEKLDESNCNGREYNELKIPLQAQYMSGDVVDTIDFAVFTEILRGRLRNELKYLLQNFPEGLKSNALQEEYKNYFGKDLNPQTFNYNSMLALCSNLDILEVNRNRIIVLKGSIRNKVAHMLQFDKYVPPPHVPADLKEDDYKEIKITHVYDPSKFWFVINFKELNLFLEYVKEFYTNALNKIKVPVGQLKADMFCIVYSNQMYYRGVIINNSLINTKGKVRIFFVDFGLIAYADVKNIYYMHMKLAGVPRFAIRGCLANIQPSVPGRMWTSRELEVFCGMIEKKRLFAKVCHIDCDRKIVHLAVGDLYLSINDYMNDLLVKQSVACYINVEISEKNESEYKSYVSKVKYLHLYPTFENLEKGGVPCSLWEKDLVRDSGVALDFIYSAYYMYREKVNL